MAVLGRAGCGRNHPAGCASLRFRAHRARVGCALPIRAGWVPGAALRVL